MSEQNGNGKPEMTHKHTLERQLDAFGWGLFFIMLGILWILPEGMVHEDAWLIGMGVIIFLISGIRYFNGIRVSMFWMMIGAFVLASGVGKVYGLSLPVLQVVLILIGISIMFRPRLVRPHMDYRNWDCCGMMRRRWRERTREITK